MSAPPPGAYGATKRTGFVGYDRSAAKAPYKNDDAKIAATSWNAARTFTTYPLFECMCKHRLQCAAPGLARIAIESDTPKAAVIIGDTSNPIHSYRCPRKSRRRSGASRLRPRQIAFPLLHLNPPSSSF